MVKDYFLVVVPTHRPEQAADCIRKLEQSLTYPSDFHVLDGSRGKMNALNYALTTLLTDKHTIYVTVDDDISLPQNWQHNIAAAFNVVPKLGLCGIDLEGTPMGEAIAANAMLAKTKRFGDVLFRNTTGMQNVAGACVAMQTSLARSVGPYPFADDGRSHFCDEDGWRSHQVQLRGYRYGYSVSFEGNVTLLEYEESEAYRTKKKADHENWKRNPSWKGR
jgi:hypothetical protein